MDKHSKRLKKVELKKGFQPYAAVTVNTAEIMISLHGKVAEKLRFTDELKIKLSELIRK